MQALDPRTVRMIFTAPQQCIFICATEIEALALRTMAADTGRKDLEIHSTAIILPGRLYAGSGWPKQVLVDWQVKLTPTQEAVLREHRIRVNNYRPPLAEGAK